jgi:hypothetical protein
MTTTHWRDAVTGDFAKAGKWDDGKPGIHTDAAIAATGANYVVKVISADAAHTLTLNSVDATLLEKTHGSLHLGTLDIEHGTAILTQANTIGDIVMTGGKLEVSTGAALGDAAIAMRGEAVLAATADAVVSNDIAGVAIQEGFAAANGKILSLDGSLTFNVKNPDTLNFTGTGIHGKGDGTGIIDIDGAVGAISSKSVLTITGVTLGTSIADSHGFDTLVSNVQRLIIGTNGVLDVTDQNDLTLHLNQGTGVLENLGAHESITLLANFGGTISGDFDITMNGGGLFGTIDLAAGDKIHVQNAAEFEAHFTGAAPSIDLVDLNGSGGELVLRGDTFSGDGPAVDLGTGQNNVLHIESNFVGIITNFGGHGGGTDMITFDNEAGNGTPTLHYQENQAGTGGELTVQFETQPAIVLNLIGHYTLSDFQAGFETILCSAEQSAPLVPAHVMDALI